MGNHFKKTKKPKKNTIKFVCISDTHNITDNLVLPEGDVLIHAGDFTSIGKRSEILHFINFLNKQNFTHKVVIAGNHELTFDEDQLDYLRNAYKNDSSFTFDITPNEAKDLIKSNAIYLENSSVDLFGYMIYGSPYSNKFYDWAFMKEDSRDMRDVWEKIPSDTDILITHGPPYDILDKNYMEECCGCKELADVVVNRVKPKFHIFGHIHESNGKIEKDGITFINASICDLTYEASNPYFVFELPVKEKITKK